MLVLGGVDSQLDFSQQPVVELHVDEDVVRLLPEPVLDPDDLQCLRLGIAEVHQLFEDGDDLPLLGGALAPNQVTEFESD